MDYGQAILLGVVQGLTEFLPISSSGHLLLVHQLSTNHVDNLSFDVALHLGTLLSLAVFYLARWRRSGWSGLVVGDNSVNRTIRLIIIACIPTAVMGLFFRHDIERMSEGVRFLASGFLVNAVLLFFTHWHVKKHTNVKKLTDSKAFLIGVAQGIAILPAVSRSCTTISAGLISGINRLDAVMFSFLISVPAISGAVILEIPHIDWHNTPFDIVAAGVLSSFLAGLVGIAGVKRLVGSGKLHIFAIYLVIVGFFTYWRFGQW